MKVIIVGGVAGGASCAARLRRLDEEAEILMVERGPYVSYANCGLPYHVGSVIEHESDLLVASPEVFRRTSTSTAAPAARRSASRPTTRPCSSATWRPARSRPSPTTSSCCRRAQPSVRPPLPGIDLPGIFAVRTVPDAREIREWIERGTSFLAGMEKYSGFQTVRPPMRGGRGRWRVHRPGDGREPRAPRVRRHRDRDGRSSARSARPRVRATRRGLPRLHGVTGRRQRRRRWVRAGRGRGARRVDPVGQLRTRPIS